MKPKQSQTRTSEVLAQPFSPPTVAPITTATQPPTIASQAQALMSQMITGKSDCKKLNIVVENNGQGQTARVSATHQLGDTSTLLHAKGVTASLHVDGTAEARRSLIQLFPNAKRSFLAGVAGVTERTIYRDFEHLRSHP